MKAHNLYKNQKYLSFQLHKVALFDAFWSIPVKLPGTIQNPIWDRPQKDLSHKDNSWLLIYLNAHGMYWIVILKLEFLGGAFE